MDAFRLEVRTIDLTRALKKLRRAERKAESFLLSLTDSGLCVCSGSTSENVPAQGSWPEPVGVSSAWADSILKTPYESLDVDLSFRDGQLWTETWGVTAWLHGVKVTDDEVLRRESNISSAIDDLAAYQVPRSKLEELVERGNPGLSRLWSPGEEKTASDVGQAWLRIYRCGVETAELRMLLHRKISRMWYSGKPRSSREELMDESPAGEAARCLWHYAVTQADIVSLIQSADRRTALLWESAEHAHARDAIRAWMRLYSYGAEPSDIRRLML
jgi:hypothetical protein